MCVERAGGVQKSRQRVESDNVELFNSLPQALNIYVYTLIAVLSDCYSDYYY